MQRVREIDGYDDQTDLDDDKYGAETYIQSCSAVFISSTR